MTPSRSPPGHGSRANRITCSLGRRTGAARPGRRDRARRRLGRRDGAAGPGRRDRARPRLGRRDGAMSVGRLAAAVIRSRGPRVITTTCRRVSRREAAGRSQNRGLPGSRCLTNCRPSRITRGRLRRPWHQAVAMAPDNHGMRPGPRISKTGAGLPAIALRTPTTTGTGISARDSRRTQNPAHRPQSARRRRGRAQPGQRTSRARQPAAVTAGWADASRQARCLTPTPTRRTVPTLDTVGRSRPVRPTRRTPVCHSPPRRMVRRSLARLIPRSPANRLRCRCRLSGRFGVGRPLLRSPLLRSRPRGHPPSRCRTIM